MLLIFHNINIGRDISMYLLINAILSASIFSSSLILEPLNIEYFVFALINFIISNGGSLMLYLHDTTDITKKLLYITSVFLEVILIAISVIIPVYEYQKYMTCLTIYIYLCCILLPLMISYYVMKYRISHIDDILLSSLNATVMVFVAVAFWYYSLIQWISIYSAVMWYINVTLILTNTHNISVNTNRVLCCMP